MSNIVKLVENFKKTQAEMMAKLKAEGENELKIVFKGIFDKHKGLKRFAFLGYTMGFNDGEPCYHTGISAVGLFEQSVGYSGRTYLNNDCKDNRNLLSFLTENEVEDDIVSVNKDCSTLQQASKDVAAIEDVVELVYDTNYLIKVELKEDGSVFVDYDEYDCGY